VRLLSQTDTFAAEPRGRIIRKDSMPEPSRHEIRRWQILISGAGQMAEGNLFGRSIMADGRLEHGFLGPDTFALEFEEPGADVNLWTYAVLNSSIGLRGVQAAAYGTSIPHLRPDLLGRLPIPAAPVDVMKRVADRIRSAVRLRESYLRDLRLARGVVESNPEVASALDMCAERRRRTLLWHGPFPTLSAWTFASLAEALSFLRSKWSGRIGDVVESDGIFRGGRGARIPCAAPHGVDFLSQRDAFLIKQAPQRVLLPSANLVPRTGTIMVGGQGTLGEGELFGRATIVSSDGATRAWSEHLLRIVPKRNQHAWLFAFLTTTVGFRLLRSAAVGTKLLSMRADLLRDLPVPSLSSSDIERVTSLVKASTRARVQAEGAEAEAVRIVEEEVLAQWLA
jgi:type I restriction enzyme S subunit